MELGRSVSRLQPLEFSSDTTFSENLSGSFPELEGLSASLKCLVFVYQFAEELCRAPSSWRASESPQGPAQGLVRAAAQPRQL